MEKGYDGPEKRLKDNELERIREGISRIASHLESETRFRDGVYESLNKIRETIYGNGKIGLVREVDKIKIDLDNLGAAQRELHDDIKKVVAWALVSSISAFGLIVFQLVKLIISHSG